MIRRNRTLGNSVSRSDWLGHPKADELEQLGYESLTLWTERTFFQHLGEAMLGTVRYVSYTSLVSRRRQGREHLGYKKQTLPQVSAPDTTKIVFQAIQYPHLTFYFN
jgi:hypothetical protein